LEISVNLILACGHILSFICFIHLPINFLIGSHSDIASILLHNYGIMNFFDLILAVHIGYTKLIVICGITQMLASLSLKKYCMLFHIY